MLEATTESLTYILYRYIAVGQYAPIPVNYTSLMFPAILAGIVGVALCLCYYTENRKKGIGRREKKELKKQYLVGFVALVLVLTVCTVLFAKAGKNEEDNENLYGGIIAGLGDDEQFSLRDIGEKCIYTASLHSLVVYRFDQKEKQWSVLQYEERFDENGDASYKYIEDGEAKTISEKEYSDAWKLMEKGTVINFGYGASDNPY